MLIVINDSLCVCILNTSLNMLAYLSTLWKAQIELPKRLNDYLQFDAAQFHFTRILTHGFFIFMTAICY